MRWDRQLINEFFISHLQARQSISQHRQVVHEAIYARGTVHHRLVDRLLFEQNKQKIRCGKGQCHASACIKFPPARMQSWTRAAVMGARTFVIINQSFFSSQRYVSLGWVLSIATVLSLIFMQIYKKINVWVSFLFPALGRLLWAVPICFFVVAGTSQYKNGVCDIDIERLSVSYTTNCAHIYTSHSQASSPKYWTPSFYFPSVACPSRRIYSIHWWLCS